MVIAGNNAAFKQDMSDTIAGLLGTFAEAVDYEAITLHLADTLACALGAASLSDGLVSRLGEMTPAGSGPATVWATGEKIDTDSAALRNAVAARFLDSNDTYVSRGIVHPSDVLAILVAFAEERQVGWSRLIEACGIAYEVMCRMADEVKMSQRGFDGSTLSPIATAAGLAWLIGLDEPTTAKALRIAALDAGTLRVVRQGKLSDWKAISSGRGAVKGLFAVRMAEAGCLPPDVVFDSDDGFVGRISGPFSFEAAGNSRLSRVILKAYPAQIFIQGMLQLAQELRPQIGGDLDNINAITINTFGRAVELVGDHGHSSGTMNRATADHSAAFCVCAVLVAGQLGHDDYDSLLADKKVRELMGKTNFQESANASAAFPSSFQSEMCVTLRSGRTLVAKQGNPSALGPEGLKSKFDALWPTDVPRAWRWSLPGKAAHFPVQNSHK